MKRILLVLLSTNIFFASSLSAEVDFCVNDNTDCKEMKVSNNAAVVVTSFKVTEKAGATGETCDGGKQRSKQNLAEFLSTGDTMVNVKLNTQCSYKFQFITTDGCTGNRSTTLKYNSNDDENEVISDNFVMLKGACGSLKAKSQIYNNYR